MQTYQAYVRAGGLVVKVQIQAENTMSAIAMLKGMYGENNIVHLPTPV